MATGDWHPTRRQKLRAALEILHDTVTLPFLRKRARTISYASAGRNIRGTIYYPESDGKAPAVLLLPTAMGLTPHEHMTALRLAREGYTTLALGYTGRTTGAVIEDEKQRKLLEQIVVDGWGVLQEDPMADADRGAVIGFSLGGYFASSLASALEERAPKAVVIYYGVYALAETQAADLHTPVLVLQGENDYTDFVANAKRIKEIWHCDEKACEVVSYPGIGHQFDLFEPNGAAARDAWERTVQFLRQHLSPREETKTATVR